MGMAAKEMGTVAENGNGCGNDCEKKPHFLLLFVCGKNVNLRQKNRRHAYLYKAAAADNYFHNI